MNKAQQIEEMAEVLRNSIAYDKTTAIEYGYTSIFYQESAEALVNAGYGNVKQAVKEFAERLKKEIIEGDGTCLDEYDIGKQDGYNSACEHHRQAIEDLITELYGADE